MKNPKTQEPTTDAEFIAALAHLGVEVIDSGDCDFTAIAKTGGSTDLDAEDISNALFEAWHLYKP